MSDLQCPARLLVTTGRPPGTDAGQDRFAAEYDARPLRLDDVLRADPSTCERLRDLADLHRGERVRVLVEGRPGSAVEVSVDADGVVVEEVVRRDP